MSSPSMFPTQKTAPLSQIHLRPSQRQRPSVSQLKVKRAISRNLAGYLFLLPAVLVFLIFVWYPIGLGFIITVTQSGKLATDFLLYETTCSCDTI